MAEKHTSQDLRTRFFALLLVLCLFLSLVGCSTGPQRVAHPALVTPPVATSTGTRSSDLYRQANFLLAMPLAFSHVRGGMRGDDGTIVPLDDATIKAEMTNELKHLLFVVDRNKELHVYSSGTAPTKVQATLNAQGQTTLSYKQTVDSEAGSITMLFSGILARDHIAVTYEQQYSPSMLINASPSDVVVTFTTSIRWVPTSEIPAAPGKGHYQVTSGGEIMLSWTPGQRAAAYDIYRLISDQSQQFQLLATIKETSYRDASADVKQHLHTTRGITYAIFSVGPTGVENPGAIILSISTQ